MEDWLGYGVLADDIHGRDNVAMLLIRYENFSIDRQ